MQIKELCKFVKIEATLTFTNHNEYPFNLGRELKRTPPGLIHTNVSLRKGKNVPINSILCCFVVDLGALIHSSEVDEVDGATYGY